MKLSVALCTYNGQAYVAEQLNSIAAQTRRPDELVISDDASTDATLKITDTFVKRAPFPVHIHQNSSNLGVRANFESAMRRCSGDIIAFADQDDVWLPEKLERLETEFKRRPEIGFAFCNANVCDQHLQPLRYTLWQSVGFTAAMQAQMRNGNAFDPILHHNVVNGATMAISARHRDWLLPIEPGWIHDNWCALLLSSIAPAAMVEQPLVLYRQHANQQIGGVRTSLWQQIRDARAMDPQQFEQHAQMYAAAARRITSGAHREKTQQKADHFATRALIHQRKTSRIGTIAREAVAGNYKRYSLGWKSIAHDLIA